MKKPNVYIPPDWLRDVLRKYFPDQREMSADEAQDMLDKMRAAADDDLSAHPARKWHPRH
jgi:hypothetical protein